MFVARWHSMIKGVQQSAKWQAILENVSSVSEEAALAAGLGLMLDDTCVCYGYCWSATRSLSCALPLRA